MSSKMAKALTMWLLVVGLAFGIQGKVMASGMFNDIGPKYWANSEIEFLYSKDVIQGYDSSTGTYFKPENKVTRAQAAKMLVISKGYEELKPRKVRFRDVPINHWASGWIERAVSLGYFQGKDNGSFDPEGLLTRSQMSKIVAKAFGLNIQASSAKPIIFDDINSSYWAASYINALYYNGITDGDVDHYRPENNTTRAQFSVFLSRAMSEKYKLVISDKVLAKGKVTSSSLNVRTAPTTASAIAGRLYKGDTVNVLSIDGYWAAIQYNGQKAFVHKTYLKLLSTSSKPLKDRIIVLDAGHGGKDPGAVNGSVYEKNIVMDVTNLLAEKLESAGAKVMLSRSDNSEFLSLGERVDYSEDQYAELFVSLHVNAAISEAAKGAETFYNGSSNDNGEESYLLANEIQKQIVSLAGMDNRGTKQGEWYVIKHQDIPAVLVELGFISNYGDRLKLTSSQYKELYAEAIYRGIISYYNK
ncbi:SH3 domain-containing protein [Rossellomorea vietnamensis]|uniref:SH3 domain-containing protein n=1 Tax=Rossellomorea vietnamensis TaxID=218284 RepID=A0A5D4MB63_9BACI|nr:N-acetylmuramoyl-L-alanine amidase [Rossellomorea vietnamensis]TYR98952.1 SH3 domain-containing protein [Rossellomorea vietnamensis]